MPNAEPNTIVPETEFLLCSDNRCLHWCDTLSQHKGTIWLERMEPYFAKMQPIWVLQEMPYSQYMNTDHWKQKCQQKLESCRRACQICNGEDRLVVHHRTYERLGQEDLEDLTVLCRSCHGIFHGKIREFARRTRNFSWDHEGMRMVS